MATVSSSITLPPLAGTFFKEVTQRHCPDARVMRKADSWFLKAVGFIMKPFNPTFMDQYITTIGKTIYVPDSFSTYNDLEALDVIAHETQHVLDYVGNRPKFIISYLFPQCVAVLSLFALLAFLNTWLLCWLFALLFLSPIPAPGRFALEVNGYRTTILFARKVYAYTDEQMAQVYQSMMEQLAGSSYYFTWPFPKNIRKVLQDERFMKEPRYQEITDFLAIHNQLHPSASSVG